MTESLIFKIAITMGVTGWFFFFGALMATSVLDENERGHLYCGYVGYGGLALLVLGMLLIAVQFLVEYIWK